LPNSTDLFDAFLSFIQKNDKELVLDDEQKRSLQFSATNLNISKSERTLSGIIESGDYGLESEIKDTLTGKKKYLKKTTDTDIKPFYFLMKIPKKKNTAIIMLQRIGIYGIHTLFKNHFERFLKDIFDDIKIELSVLVSQELAKKFIDQGNIKEISLRRYNLPADIISKLGFNISPNDLLSVEFKLVSKPHKWFNLRNKVKSFISNPDGRFFDVNELNGLGFNNDSKTKLKISLNGTYRTIDLSDTGEIRPYYDINDEVKKMPNGHPQFRSIDDIAKNFLKDFEDEVYS